MSIKLKSFIYSNKLFYSLAIAMFVMAPVLAHADTINLRNGEVLKGLIVERHYDRMILSTEQGETPVMKVDIDKVIFDDPAVEYLFIAREYEEKGQLGPALYHYQKALQINPHLEEAKKAELGLRNRYSRRKMSGPKSIVDQKNAIFDAWNAGEAIAQKNKSTTPSKSTPTQEKVFDQFGFEAQPKEPGYVVTSVKADSPASYGQLERGDYLCAIDGESILYAPETYFYEKLERNADSLILDFERVFSINKQKGDHANTLGITWSFGYNGLVIASVADESVAAKAGLKAGDKIVMVAGQTTRYTPLKKIESAVAEIEGPCAFLIRRSVILSRR